MYTCREFKMLDSSGNNHDSSSSSTSVPSNAKNNSCNGACGAYVVLDGDDQGLAAGQYAVLYQGGRCLGAAKITGAAAA